MPGTSPAIENDAAVASQLNQSCHCIAVNRQQLLQSLGDGTGDPRLASSLDTTHRDLFSSSPVFVAESQLHAMQSVVDAIERLAKLDGFEDLVATRLREAGLRAPSFRPEPLLSYDFHISDDGPQLIEVNTNPGGVLLGLHIQSAQEACCPEVRQAHYPLSSRAEVEAALVEMVTAAALLRLESRAVKPINIAIVDDDPANQFLHPEFLLYQQLFERHGHGARIVDPNHLAICDGRLTADGWPIDVVYNRSTDFVLEHPQSAILRDAWQRGLVGITPDPVAWARFADKHNLVVLSDPDQLARLGLSETAIANLRVAVPATSSVSEEHAEQLWTNRKHLFFKPTAGHGSRGAYDGKKLSRGKFAEILTGNYVAQERIQPSERRLLLDETELLLKLDLRCITWRGRIIMLMARLYRGQTTNMRTPGGGLATALVFSPEIMEPVPKETPSS